MISELKTRYRSKMEQAVQDLGKAYGTIRTGRASVSLVDHLQVEAYGAKMPLLQLASIGTPDARTIAIQPFDPSQIGTISKAILASDLGITPNNDGRIVRLTIPSLTEDRRKDLVKTARKYAEDHRVTVRQIRHHLIDELKTLEKDSKISEDDLHKQSDEAQKLTDEFIGKIEEELKRKEAEIMEV
ncbi:ribosome recycling factor [Candidatus Sumerlaeota bacterium]|nr:ribosome recycling factor [Candidatus Sumerlaeota bacterium]